MWGRYEEDISTPQLDYLTMRAWLPTAVYLMLWLPVVVVRRFSKGSLTQRAAEAA